MTDRLRIWADEEISPPERTVDPDCVVYYARRRQLYKIGTTNNVKRRMAQLDVDELLAVEPGSYDLEQMRLRQFDHLRIAPGHEWLYPSEDLMSHIEMIKRHAERTAE